MERIINNPGFEDIAKNIFMLLNLNDVANCQLVSRSFNGFLENPMFWLKKWITRGLSKKNQKDWITAIDKMDKTKDTEFIKNILLYFKKMLKKCEFIDMPCFIEKRQHSMKYFQKNQKSLEKLFHHSNRWCCQVPWRIWAPNLYRVLLGPFLRLMIRLS